MEEKVNLIFITFDIIMISLRNYFVNSPLHFYENRGARVHKKSILNPEYFFYSVFILHTPPAR